VLGPLLEAEGFSGAWPYWHRSGREAIECVIGSAMHRGGVQIHLGTVPSRARLDAKSAQADARATQTPTGRYTMVLQLSIETAAHVRALEGRLRELGETLRRGEGKAFFAAHASDLRFRAQRAEVSAALDAGSVARLRRALAPLSPREAQRLLDAANVPRWHAPGVTAKAFRLFPVLRQHRPPWLLGALACAGGVEAGRGDAVLAWTKPHLRRVRHLAGQIAILADALAPRDARAAAILFDHVAKAHALSAPQWGNATWAALATNAKKLDRAIASRLVRAALRAAPTDPSVHFNAACFFVEQGESKRALAELLTALRLGAPPEHVRRERLLRELARSPAVEEALRIVRPAGRDPATRGGFRTHGAPTLR
jgi:hypothetical protein